MPRLSRPKWMLVLFIGNLMATVLLWKALTVYHQDLSGSIQAASAMQAMEHSGFGWGFHVLSIAALLAAILYFFQKARNRAQISESARRDLMEEIARRKKSENKLRLRTLQLEAANKELEAFCCSVSHDLRAPLRSIEGFSKVLLTRHANGIDDKGKDYLDRVHGACRKMSLLIEALLNLSRLNRSSLKRGKVDVTGISRSILEDLRRQEPGRDVAISLQDGLTAFGDAQLVETVLQNLIGNAWKFTSAKCDGASIEIGEAIREGRRLLFVRDNGAGFDMAYAHKLFRIFQRLHAPWEFPGTGVGLATVKRVIHRHRGSLFVEAEVDRGAAFYFSFENEEEEQHGPLPAPVAPREAGVRAPQPSGPCEALP